jgi:hypothetical protein
MTVDEFRQSLTATEPPSGLTHAVAGLWWDAKGDWTRAHESAQEDEGPEARGSTPTYIVRKAIKATQSTGMVGRASLFVMKRSMRNGSSLLRDCWDNR